MLYVFQYLTFHACIIRCACQSSKLETLGELFLGVIVQCFCKIRLPAPRLSPIVDFESNYFQKVETLKLQKQNSVYQRMKTDWKGVWRSGNNLSDISCSCDILVQL